MAADEFLKARGIILRRVAAYGLPNCLRMTIGTEDDNRGVVAALAELHGRAAGMSQPMFERVALIGLGLIGSSLSHAMRRGGLAGSIVGHAHERETRDTALRLGLVERGVTTARRRRCAAPISSSCACRSAPAGRSPRRWRRSCGQARS